MVVNNKAERSGKKIVNIFSQVIVTKTGQKRDFDVCSVFNT